MTQWRVAEAKERFSELVRSATDEPQQILNRDRLVACLVDARTFYEFEEWRRQQSQSTLAEAFAELRAICADEEYSLEAPPREDRPNPFAEILD